MRERIQWLDVAKGIGILCVVYGHATFTNEIWRIWIYSFHMPLFFFLSGITYNENKYASFKSLLISKTKAILIPYILFCILALGRNVVEQMYLFWKTGQSFQVIIFAKKISGIFIALRGSDWSCTAWFLQCIFVVYCMMYAVFSIAYKLKPKDRMVVVMFAIFSFMMGILYAKSHLSYIPWAADVALVAFFFTIAGWMCKKIKLGSVKKTTAFFCVWGGTLCFELLLEQYSS